MSSSRILFVVSFLLILTGALFAQNKSKITGRVLDTNGAPVTRASLSLSLTNMRFERQTVTDGSGGFEFNNLVEGNYRISATAKTFGTATRDLRLSTPGKGSGFV